jgi:hypothetical protein
MVRRGLMGVQEVESWYSTLIPVDGGFECRIEDLKVVSESCII